MVWLFLVVFSAALAASSLGTAWAQAKTDTLGEFGDRKTLATVRQVMEERYQVLPVQDGILMIPRYGGTKVQSIELSNGDIAVNGEAVTGAELRAFVADDTDAILRLSYLDTETRRVLFGIGAPPPVAPSDTVTADTTAVAEREERREIDARSEGDRVRIGGSVTVREGERIDGDVVAVGGNVSIYGTVDGDVSAVGGTVRLGPAAVVHGDVTAAGGQVIREPGAEVHGRINETTLDSPVDTSFTRPSPSASAPAPASASSSGKPLLAWILAIVIGLAIGIGALYSSLKLRSRSR